MNFLFGMSEKSDRVRKQHFNYLYKFNHMAMLDILSIIFVLIGAVFMLTSIVLSIKALPTVPPRFKHSWKILTGLMVFFFCGYLIFVITQMEGLHLHMGLVAGVVFLGGAVFVFLILHLARKIISMLLKSKQKLYESKQELEVKVEERTHDLEKSNTELKQILNCSADGIAVVGLDYTIQRVNGVFAEMTGFAEEDLIGMNCYDSFVKKETCESEYCSVKTILKGEKRVDKEIVLQTHDGRSIPCLVTAFPFYSPENELIGIVEEFRDISARKKMEDRLRELSITDELTGLLNRRGFLAIAEKHFALGNRFEKHMYLLYADIDNMKWINDNLGHSFGDEALIETADVLKNTFRKADLICIGRLGGDEYAVLMFSNRESEDFEHPTVKRVEKNIAERNKIPDRQYALSVSMGIVRYSPEEFSSLEEFISRGDDAMYSHKREKQDIN